jgi:hypothetical protein
MKVDKEEINRTASLDAVSALCIQTIHFISFHFNLKRRVR